MSAWGQNKRGPQKKNQNQIRGSKGAKYYQSNKASGYGNGNFCTLGCQTEWDNEYMDRAIDALGIRIYEAKKINVDDAWYVEYSSSWRNQSNEDEYYLRNKLKGIRRAIPRQQAQTPEQIAEDHSWSTIDDTQAKELAIQLGLAS